jgi:hypothetical protein
VNHTVEIPVDYPTDPPTVLSIDVTFHGSTDPIVDSMAEVFYSFESLSVS